jgi:hypothetical protein
MPMIPMTIYPFRASTYARNIYLFGTASFSTISQEYVEPVKEYAALHYTLAQIDNALAQGWITQQEYDDTIGYLQ